MVERMNSANIAHVPVIARSDSQLVGYLGWKDIIAFQALAHGGDSSIAVRDSLARRAEHSSAL